MKSAPIGILGFDLAGLWSKKSWVKTIMVTKNAREIVGLGEKVGFGNKEKSEICNVSRNYYQLENYESQVSGLTLLRKFLMFGRSSIQRNLASLHIKMVFQNDHQKIDHVSPISEMVTFLTFRLVGREGIEPSTY